MDCISPVKIYPLKNDRSYYFLNPCGKCLPCLKHKASDLSARAQCESSVHSDGSVFATLTYDDDHLPEGGSIVPSHFRDYVHNVKVNVKVQDLAYLGSAEYGDAFKRPHGHILFFGIPYKPCEFDLCNSVRQKSCPMAFLCKAWKFGFVKFAPVNPKSCNYVAGYVVKKEYGGQDNVDYKAEGLVSPFHFSSRCLGYRYFLRNLMTISTYGFGLGGGEVRSIPRVWLQKFERDHAKGLVSDACYSFFWRNYGAFCRKRVKTDLDFKPVSSQNVYFSEHGRKLFYQGKAPVKFSSVKTRYSDAILRFLHKNRLTVDDFELFMKDPDEFDKVLALRGEFKDLPRPSAFDAAAYRNGDVSLLDVDFERLG